jgi:hypothetical protein
MAPGLFLFGIDAVAPGKVFCVKTGRKVRGSFNSFYGIAGFLRSPKSEKEVQKECLALSESMAYAQKTTGSIRLSRGS